MSEIPKDHPRAESLRHRHAIIKGMQNQVVAEAGLIAHGRGEAFDYLIGERTHPFAVEAMKAALELIHQSKNPILSVNGNIAALCPVELVKFCKLLNIPMEINLFYRKPGRLEAIERALMKAGAENILGLDPTFASEIDELSSMRRIVDSRGILKADTVIVPLEDGDRTEALLKVGKKVITVDLNPLSRTAKNATITIVDNVVRVFPMLIKLEEERKLKGRSDISMKNYNNNKILSEAMNIISEGWKNNFMNN